MISNMTTIINARTIMIKTAGDAGRVPPLELLVEPLSDIFLALFTRWDKFL